MDHALEIPPTIEDDATLRSCYPPSSRLAQLKQLDHIDAHCRAFIERSPFLVIGSTRRGCGTDVSPRGDAPGFVRVLDEHTMAIPDRPGNNRLDTMSNIVGDAEVGLLFFIPGIEETVRVNGTARLSRDPGLLEASAVQGKAPLMMIVVTVREAFYHCSKALKRARLWQDDYRLDRSTLPSLGRIIVEQTRTTEISVEQADAAIAKSAIERLY
jgi:PPOX class probable FMN-dependent enzyme